MFFKDLLWRISLDNYILAIVNMGIAFLIRRMKSNVQYKEYNITPIDPSYKHMFPPIFDEIKPFDRIEDPYSEMLALKVSIFISLPFVDPIESKRYYTYRSIN